MVRLLASDESLKILGAPKNMLEEKRTHLQKQLVVQKQLVAAASHGGVLFLRPINILDTTAIRFFFRFRYSDIDGPEVQ